MDNLPLSPPQQTLAHHDGTTSPPPNDTGDTPLHRAHTAAVRCLAAMVVCAVEPATCSDVTTYFPLACALTGGGGRGAGGGEHGGEEQGGGDTEDVKHAVGVRELQEVWCVCGGVCDCECMDAYLFECMCMSR